MFSFKLKKKPRDKATSVKEAMMRAGALMGGSIVAASVIDFNLASGKKKNAQGYPVGMAAGTIMGAAVAAAAAAGLGAAITGMGGLKINHGSGAALDELQAAHKAAMAAAQQRTADEERLKDEVRREYEASITEMTSGTSHAITVKGPLRLTGKRSWTVM